MVAENENWVIYKKTKPKEDVGLKLYPNPSYQNGSFWIRATLPKGENTAFIKIYDITGNLLFTTQTKRVKNIKNFYKVFNINKLFLNKGVYLVNLSTQTTSATKKLIVQ